MRVSEIMTRQPVTVSRETSLDDVQELMHKAHIRHLVVADAGEVCGVLSDRDVLAATGGLPARVHAARGPGVAESLPKTAQEIMDEAVVSVAPEDDVRDALVVFRRGAIGFAPVIEHGKLVGIVSEMDVLQAFDRGCEDGWLPASFDSPVSALMTPAPSTIVWETPIADAHAIARSLGVRHLPVVQHGSLIGLVSDRDLQRAAGAGRRGTTTVDEIMTRDVATIAPTTSVSEAARTMAQRKIGTLPVVEDDELVGIVTVTDLLAHCEEAFREGGA